jgi:hypothetical protein
MEVKNMKFSRKNLKSTLVGFALTLFLCASTAINAADPIDSFNPQQSYDINQLLPLQQSYGYSSSATLISIISSLATPWLLKKCDITGKTLGNLAVPVKAFSVPLASYGVWKGMQWLRNKFGNSSYGLQEDKKAKEEEVKTQTELRKNIIVGGVSSIITTIIVKSIKSMQQPPISKSQPFFKKCGWFFLKIGVGWAVSYGINRLWNALWSKPKITPKGDNVGRQMPEYHPVYNQTFAAPPPPHSYPNNPNNRTVSPYKCW